MDIDELIKDKTVKSKEKIEVLSNWLLEGIISARTLIGYAEKANDPAKATCLEAMKKVSSE